MSATPEVNNKENNNSSRSSSLFNAPTNRTERNEAENEEPKAFVGDLEMGESKGVPDGGDELTRYESNPAAARTLSHRMAEGKSLLNKANKTNELLPKIGGGREFPPYLGDRSPFMVTFDGPKDPIHPHNWSSKRKIVCSVVVGFTALAVTIGSAIFSTVSNDIMEKFNVGSTVATLGTSLFVFGFASGPIIWGPMSELYGRKIVLIPSCFGFVCFSFAVASANDLQTIMICRFFAGFIGAAPLVAVPAAIADMFGAAVRGQAMAIFGIILFGGPELATIFCGFTVKNDALGWRWTSYFSALIGCLALIGVTFYFDETHHPLILVKQAETLRRRTGNWAVQAPHEEFTLSLKEICQNNISRPLVMLFTEPILLLISIYTAFIYGLLYLLLTAIPLIFMGNYHFVQGVGQLPYLAVVIGLVIGGAFRIFFEKRFHRIMVQNDGKPIAEERLPPMMVGSFFFSGGLFWLGWAGDFPEKVHWIVPTIGCSFVGFGLITIFLPCINYIIDCYLYFAASALAGNTFMRSSFGGAFPLFARQMFLNMEIKWASTLLGCFAAILIPVPFLFYKYGKSLRTRSKYAVVL